MEQRLTLVTLGVGDLDRSVAYYEGLGWRRAMRDAQGVAFFQLGGIGLSLYPLPDLTDDAGLPSEPLPRFRGIALAYNVRSREEVDAVSAEMSRLGGSLVKPPEEKFWGGYGAYAADPDGHLWEIAWNPGFPLDEDGAVAIPD
jgi:catechol 2,3-dioxygenase-like lactoylglutathione lyase family enzyme